MRWLSTTFFMVAGCALGLAAWVLAGEAPGNTTDVAELVAALGSEHFAERESASQQLDKLGPVALEALRSACRSEDAEVRRRAEELVERIEKRVETAKLTKPSQVRWVFQKTPVTEAIADISRKTGFTIELAGKQPEMSRRKITLDTGDLPLWQAWERFCAEAELVETQPPPLEPVKPGKGPTAAQNRIVINGVPANRATPATDVLNIEPEKLPPTRLTVAVGNRKTLPTCFAGNVRIRAMPPTSVPVNPLPEEEISVDLEVAVEPTLRCLLVHGVRVLRALDNADQSLAQRMLAPEGPLDALARAKTLRKNVIFVNGVPIDRTTGLPITPDGAPAADPRLIPVRLYQPDTSARKQPLRMLKELTGHVVALVQPPPETLVTVDDILKARDQTVRGKSACSVTVAHVNSEKDGSVHMRVLVTPPSQKGGDVPDANPTAMMRRLNGVVIVNGVMMNNVNPFGLAPVRLTARNFTLLDDKGQAFEVVRAVNTGKGTATAQELELTYKPKKGQGEATRFVYSGPRNRVIEVPFTLKDVPLR